MKYSIEEIDLMRVLVDRHIRLSNGWCGRDDRHDKLVEERLRTYLQQGVFIGDLERLVEAENHRLHEEIEAFEAQRTETRLKAEYGPR